jgi:hypothetical protein
MTAHRYSSVLVFLLYMSSFIDGHIVFFPALKYSADVRLLSVVAKGQLCCQYQFQ